MFALRKCGLLLLSLALVLPLLLSSFSAVSAQDPIDSDRDGLPDSIDKCPDTAPGTIVDIYGCAASIITGGSCNCGLAPDHNKCVTVRDNPATPEDEFYVSDECYQLEAYRKCLTECVEEEPGPVAVPNSMALTVFTDKKTYAPGGTVMVDGSVKDAEVNGILEVYIVIEVEGTDISTSTYSGIVYGSRGGYSTILPIPSDFPPGTYTVKVTASKEGYPDVSQTTSFSVWLLKIEVEGNYTGVAADGISELRFIVEFPKEAKNPLFYCDSDEQGGVFDDIPQPNCELVSDQPGKMEIKFKPREEIKEPHKVQVYVGVDMPDGQLLEANKEVQVVRPPVVFIHGIWSNRASMMPLRRSLINTGQYPAGHTLVVDYSTPPSKSTQDLRKSAKILADGVDRTLDKLEKEGIKVSRVDIVAHSMGGLISRYYILFGYMDSNGKVIGPGQAAKVRKLITLDTPHAGSPVADWYVDFMKNRYVACGNDSAKFDGNKVTDNELEWFLNIIRSEVKMPSDGLEFGEAVKQIQTPGRNGSIIDDLRKGQSVSHVRYYLIAGDTSLLKLWEKWFIVYEVMSKYPWLERGYSLEQTLPKRPGIDTGTNRLIIKEWGSPGPCGEYIGIETSNYTERTVVRDMVSEFRDKIGEDGTDGVVTTQSQLDSTIPAKERVTFHSNHFDITTNTQAHDMVMRYLTDHQVRSSGTTAISKSPGHLHVYDKEGRHVWLDPNGQPDIGINGADYVPFSDMMGEHEYIWVPETDGIRVEFLANDEGTVGLDISQGLDEGLHWFSYENISVASGSKVSIQLHPTTPTGQIVHSNGTTENIVPAHSEIHTNQPPTASFSIMPENPEVGDYIVVASTSSDPDGDTLTYSWYVDGVSRFGNSPNWEWENPEAGEHTIKLVVEDSKGGSDEHLMEMNVRKGLPPQQLLPIPLLLFATGGVAGLAFLIFLLVTRRRPAPAAPPVIQPEELVSRRPPARPEGPPERLGGGKPSGPPETLD